MSQSDIGVSSFYVPNPFNYLINNHGAGGDFNGFEYQIKSKPDGTSPIDDACISGYPIGLFENNVAHSFKTISFRITKIIAREFPCQSIRNDWIEDPWSENPSVESRLSGYTTYKNGEAGV